MDSSFQHFIAINPYYIEETGYTAGLAVIILKINVVCEQPSASTESQRWMINLPWCALSKILCTHNNYRLAHIKFTGIEVVSSNFDT